jgi:hypothetical protein
VVRELMFCAVSNGKVLYCCSASATRNNNNLAPGNRRHCMRKTERRFLGRKQAWGQDIRYNWRKMCRTYQGGNCVSTVMGAQYTAIGQEERGIWQGVSASQHLTGWWKVQVTVW